MNPFIQSTDPEADLACLEAEHIGWLGRAVLAVLFLAMAAIALALAFGRELRRFAHRHGYC